MNSLKLFLVIFVACFFSNVVGAYMHEADIQRECAVTGRSNSSTWRGELICSPVEKEKLNAPANT